MILFCNFVFLIFQYQMAIVLVTTSSVNIADRETNLCVLYCTESLHNIPWEKYAAISVTFLSQDSKV